MSVAKLNIRDSEFLKAHYMKSKYVLHRIDYFIADKLKLGKTLNREGITLEHIIPENSVSGIANSKPPEVSADEYDLLKHRLGKINVSGKKYGDKFKVNGVTFSFHPAGHVPGSSQIRVEYKGEVWVFTGDFKTQDDKISTPFEPTK